jgi:hypothetical protein
VCEVGDRLTCKVRGRVVVTGFHQGPIPWPSARGRLVVCGDLGRALRQEPLAAVAHWWGVSVSTVWVWRKAMAAGRPATAHRHWTEEEDRLVRALSPEDVARWTGRSFRSVYARRNALGVRRRASS